MVDRHKAHRTCEICGIKERHANEKLFFARFPSNELRCKEWLQVVGKEDLIHLPIEKLHELKHVCGKHFQRRDFTKSGTRLKKRAVPKLHLTATPLDEDKFVEFPSHLANVLQTSIATQEIKSLNETVDKSGEGSSTQCLKKKKIDTEIVLQPSTSIQKNNEDNTGKASTQGLKRKIEKEIEPQPSTATEKIKSLNEAEDKGGEGSSKQCLKRKIDTEIDATPRKRKLIAQLRKTKCTLASLKKSAKLIENLSSPVLKEFVESALKNEKRKPQGKRWTTKNKISALAIFKRSPKAYRYLQHVMPLPSVKTLTNILKNIPMEPGINKVVLNYLEQLNMKWNKKDKLCVLCFDEMALKRRLVYNPASDKVEGFTDFGGENGRSGELADHALVFLLQGIRKKFKQPLAFYFTKDTVSSQKLAELIKEIISSVNERGFQIIATVCDQGSTNRGALNILKEDNEANWFECNGEKIYIIYDVPHLFKNIRNNFMKNGTMKMNGKTASWKHLKEVDEVNKNFLYMSKITANHINPTYRAKMKVKYAAQMLSQTVAAVLKLLSMWRKNEARQTELLETGDIVEELNRLFDFTNGPSCKADIKKGIRENVSQKTKHIEVWCDFRKKLQTVKFLNSRGLEPKNVQCIKGYINTLKSLRDLWMLLKENYRFKYLNLRQLNQDALENLFGLIRQHSPTNKHPTCASFMAALKTSVITRMTAPHSKGSNCEKDLQNLLTDFHDLVFEGEKTSGESHMKKTKEPLHQEIVPKEQGEELPVLNIPDFDDIQFLQFEDDLLEISDHPLVYVSGYIASALLKKHECNVCRQNLTEADPTKSMFDFIKLREWWADKKSLTYPSIDLCHTVQTALLVFEEDGMKYLHQKNICQWLVTQFYSRCDVTWFCPDHAREKICDMFHRLGFLFIRRQCQKTNASLALKEERLANATKKGEQLGLAK